MCVLLRSRVLERASGQDTHPEGQIVLLKDLVKTLSNLSQYIE